MDWAWRVCLVLVVGLFAFHFIYSADWASSAELTAATMVGWPLGALVLVVVRRRRAGHDASDGRS